MKQRSRGSWDIKMKEDESLIHLIRDGGQNQSIKLKKTEKYFVVFFYAKRCRKRDLRKGIRKEMGRIITNIVRKYQPYTGLCVVC